MRKLTAAVLAVGMSLATPAMAWQAFHLQGNTYAILCADGAIFTYTGSGSGISISGDALCEGHGGVANPGGGQVGTVKKAKPAMQSGSSGSGGGLARPSGTRSMDAH